MDLKSVPRWLFAAAFLLLVVLLGFLAITGRTLQYYPTLAFNTQHTHRIEVREVGDGSIVQAPWGNHDDWVIIVVPVSAGLDEPGSEDDNALQNLEFRAEPEAEAAATWRIIARYKFNGDLAGTKNATWVGARALAVLLPKEKT